MRYIPVDNVTFTNAQGKNVDIKTMREYPTYETMVVLKINSNAKLDEIASRKSIYGVEGEGESYKIFDHNRVRLMEVWCEMDKIKKLDIPL